MGIPTRFINMFRQRKFHPATMVGAVIFIIVIVIYLNVVLRFFQP